MSNYENISNFDSLLTLQKLKEIGAYYSSFDFTEILEKRSDLKIYNYALMNDA